MMRKRVLLTGAMMATILTVSTCGSKNTTEIVTTVGTTTAMEMTIEENTAEGSTATAEGTESEKAEDLAPEQIKSFTEEIQAVVAAQDISWLADLSSYPVCVSLEEGGGSGIESVGDFMTIGEDKPFTEKLVTQIADVKPKELEVSSTGVIMGEDVNITFDDMDEEPEITGINL